MGDHVPLGSRIFAAEAMQEASTLHFSFGSAAILSTPPPAAEGVNEDAAAVFELAGPRGVLAVADGMGGSRSGAEASGRVLQALAHTVADVDPETDLRGPILDGIERANREVRELGTGAGATLAVVEVSGERVRPYHVGDAAVMLIGARGRVKLQTIAHGPVGYAVEAGVLDEADAMLHEDRHLVSNIVGDAEMRIEVGASLRFAPRDTLLLGSDGLFDNVHADEITELVRKGPLAEAAGLLQAACQQRMIEARGDDPSKPDDLTFILLRRSAGSGDA